MQAKAESEINTETLGQENKETTKETTTETTAETTAEDIGLKHGGNSAPGLFSNMLGAAVINSPNTVFTNTFKPLAPHYTHTHSLAQFRIAAPLKKRQKKQNVLEEAKNCVKLRLC